MSANIASPFAALFPVVKRSRQGQGGGKPIVIPAKTISAAILELSGGKKLSETAEKYGLDYRYLHRLSRDKSCRPDVPR